MHTANKGGMQVVCLDKLANQQVVTAYVDKNENSKIQPSPLDATFQMSFSSVTRISLSFAAGKMASQRCWFTCSAATKNTCVYLSLILKLSEYQARIIEWQSISVSLVVSISAFSSIQCRFLHKGVYYSMFSCFPFYSRDVMIIVLETKKQCVRYKGKC